MASTLTFLRSHPSVLVLLPLSKNSWFEGMSASHKEKETGHRLRCSRSLPHQVLPASEEEAGGGAKKAPRGPQGSHTLSHALSFMSSCASHTRCPTVRPGAQPQHSYLAISSILQGCLWGCTSYPPEHYGFFEDNELNVSCPTVPGSVPLTWQVVKKIVEWMSQLISNDDCIIFYSILYLCPVNVWINHHVLVKFHCHL